VGLQDLTEQVLQIKFPRYEASHEGNVWEACDDLIQKGEYVLRGHAACIPNTMYYTPEHHHAAAAAANNNNKDGTDSPAVHIGQMQAIVNHFEEEGKLYMDLRRQIRSSLVLYNPDDSSITVNSEEGSIQQQEEEEEEDCAGPGPTVDMWDVLLDTGAVTTSRETPVDMARILRRVLERHEEDGGAERNTNPYTVPTILTFNAVLRGVANAPYVMGEGDNGNDNDDDDNAARMRDEALQTAFGVYDEMRFHVDRNAATYAYMLRVVAKFLPPSKTRGNIAHGLWTHAKRNHVASRQVLEALHHTNIPSNGVDFDEWFRDNVDIKNTPLNWRKNYKLRRYNRDDETY
jgi:hypothetical protein